MDQLVSKRAAKHLMQFRSDVKRSFSDRVREVVLFGSRARGDSRPTSDYDVAVVMMDDGDRRGVDHVLSDLAYPHIIAGVHIRPVSIPASYIENSDPSALSYYIKRDGVVIQ